MNLYALAAGAIVATYVVATVRKTELEKRKWIYPLFLATFPVYYWVFAVYGADYEALLNELLVGILFIALAYGTYKISSYYALLVLGIAYIAHTIYDLVHDILFVNPGTPLWWPEFCGSVDALIGTYLLIMVMSREHDR